MFKKLLSMFLAATILLIGVCFAVDSNVYTFFRQATSSMGWTGAASGTPVAVDPYALWTCQADTSSTTALTIKVLGNLFSATTTSFATNSTIAIETCDPASLANSNVCIFSITNQPALNMRMDVTNLSGTTTSLVKKIRCLGIY